MSPELKDIDVSNLSTLSLEVYIPASTDFTGALANTITIGWADQSCVQQWWTEVYTYTANDMPTDTWHTLTYDIAAAAEGDPASREISLDALYISFGGGNHTETATIYIRNLDLQ